jgi:hypothetical protein
MGPSPGSWTGLAGLRDGFRELANAWEGMRYDVDDYRELDGERVLMLYQRSGRGKTSGLELGQMPTQGADVLHVRYGAVRKLVFYGTARMCSPTSTSQRLAPRARSSLPQRWTKQALRLAPSVLSLRTRLSTRAQLRRDFRNAPKRGAGFW